MNVILSIKDFCKLIYDLLKNKYYVMIGVGGFMGMGKTTFDIQLVKEYAKISSTYWDFDRITWSRKELIMWIDGKKSEINKKTGLKEGQLPKFSPIIVDELFHIFYKRTWFEADQIDAIATFNMCRDRHLLICGNIPNFWELDTSFQNAVMFYVYIVKRGIAWVFEKENNPFTKDSWNVSENRKLFRNNKKSPYKIPNFIGEIHFNELTKEEEKKYLEIRAIKRVKALEERKIERERYKDIKNQRDTILAYWDKDRRRIRDKVKNLPKEYKKLFRGYNKALTNKTIAELIGISHEAVRLIRSGER